MHPRSMRRAVRFTKSIHRHDFVIGPRDLGGVLNGLIRAVRPEIKKAQYDDPGGYFRRHHDNSVPSVAFRQFALSVNLNTGAGISSFPSKFLSL